MADDVTGRIDSIRTGTLRSVQITFWNAEEWWTELGRLSARAPAEYSLMFVACATKGTVPLEPEAADLLKRAFGRDLFSVVSQILSVTPDRLPFADVTDADRDRILGEWKARIEAATEQPVLPWGSE